jgi:hypothetical protein
MPDLFEWADERPKADVIDFLERREQLPRWILRPDPDDLAGAFLAFDRAVELEPEAPILPFPRRA